MFKEMSENCDWLTVLLHSDPSIERPHKLKPILSVEDRTKVLMGLKGVKEVLSYTYEKELYELLKEGRYTIRFLGDDYRDKPFTGVDLNAWVHYLNRDHGWSTTKFKKLIAESV
jgi:glycerol-3-phosphate cytidylyltransferase